MAHEHRLPRRHGPQRVERARASDGSRLEHRPQPVRRPVPGRPPGAPWAVVHTSGAGLGRPPEAAPAGFPDSHIDAFVWVKPPGESDGASEDIPNDEGKRPDPM